MNRRFIPALGVLLLGLNGCADNTVKPLATSDQVIAAQYHARGDQGTISGPEIGAITDAYRQQIAQPSQKTQSLPSNSMENNVNP
jgi:hypothetical protein